MVNPQLVHNPTPPNRTKNVRFYPSVSSGKEKDAETGHGYLPHQARQAHHGARYMDHELMTMWLSVDPMADKYPSMSPYAYCAWNPIIAKDPNGMDSIHTPNGMANAGNGYRATEDGMYLYGNGLQPKKWNPDLELGGVVGSNLLGGYEDCDLAELPLTNNVAVCQIATPISVPAVFAESSILSEVFKDGYPLWAQRQ